MVGFLAALHAVADELLPKGLTDHVPRHCIVCNPQAVMSDGSDANEDQFNSLSAEVRIIYLVLLFGDIIEADVSELGTLCLNSDGLH